MAKLVLKFEERVLKEVDLQNAVVTVGRLPNNTVQIDNPAVSSLHAKFFWDGSAFVVEDNDSMNGTIVNNAPVKRHTLRGGDEVKIGKHTLLFKDEGARPSADKTIVEAAPKPLPKMAGTMVLDTKAAREMMAAVQAGRPPGSAAAKAPDVPKAAVQERHAQLTVMKGKTDQKQYTLAAKLTNIGKSEMATVRLKGWFTPAVVAVITKQQNKYMIAPAGSGKKVRINGMRINAQIELQDGDVIEVGSVKLSFAYC